MEKSKWKSRIVDACKEAGTYEDYFEQVIDTLASILEKRDVAEKQFKASGSQATITHINKAKESNVAKNPELTIIIDLNAQALAYWRDLGLTPSGLKKLNMMKAKPETNALESILASLDEN